MLALLYQYICELTYVQSWYKICLQAIEEGSAAEAKKAQQRAQQSASLRLIEVHAQGVRNLIDWIFGAGEKWLLTMHEIGESYDDAKQLLKDHIELETKTKVIIY